jgi:DNA-binding transcriptional LysR family regulator
MVRRRLSGSPLPPRIVLEGGAPSALVALALAGYGIAIVPSNVRVPRGRIRALPLVQRGVPVGRWLNVACDSRRFLAPYAMHFVDELAPYAASQSAATRGAPPLPRLAISEGGRGSSAAARA